MLRSEEYLHLYLVIDGGAYLNQQEAVGNHRKDAKNGGEEDCQPNVRLVKGVSCCPCINT